MVVEIPLFPKGVAPAISGRRGIYISTKFVIIRFLKSNFNCALLYSVLSLFEHPCLRLGEPVSRLMRDPLMPSP